MPIQAKYKLPSGKELEGIVLIEKCCKRLGIAVHKKGKGQAIIGDGDVAAWYGTPEARFIFNRIVNDIADLLDNYHVKISKREISSLLRQYILD